MRRFFLFSICIILISFYLGLFNLYPEPEEGVSAPISLDFKGMDITDVLKLLSQKSGLNIVAGKNVKGTVTIYLKDIEALDALDIILSTNELAYEKEDNLIKVMTEREYEQLYGKRFHDKTEVKIIKLYYTKASEAVKTLNQVKTNVGKIVIDERSNTVVLVDVPESIQKMRRIIEEMDVPSLTEVFTLNYAKVEDIKPQIEELISKETGSLKIDARTNRVVVKDTPERLEYIKKVIEAFDEKTQEVLIDAKIVQITLSDKYGYGIDWTALFEAGVEGALDINLPTGLTNVTSNAFTLASTKGGDSAVLSFLETFGKTDILSTPRITVADKQEAKILVGAKEAYVTSTVTTLQGGTTQTADNIQFVDVGVSLSVTPIINKEGYITMKIKPEVSNVTSTLILYYDTGAKRGQVPIVSTSEADTTVMVKDGTTLIIGGLMKNTDTENIAKVPILGDVPVVGGLFRSKGISKEKTELVIFLTPHIVTGDVSSAETAQYLEEPKEENLEKEITTFVSSVKKGESYEAYSMVVKKMIDEEVMKAARPSKSGDVQLWFILDSQGFLKKGPFVLNSPNIELVQAAVKSVKQAMPFPPFPEGIAKEEEAFEVSIRYE